MSFKEVTCNLLVCDTCGEGEDNGDYVPHYRPGDAPNEALDAYWKELDDGKHICPGCQGLYGEPPKRPVMMSTDGITRLPEVEAQP